MIRTLAPDAEVPCTDLVTKLSFLLAGHLRKLFWTGTPVRRDLVAIIISVPVHGDCAGRMVMMLSSFVGANESTDSKST